MAKENWKIQKAKSLLVHYFKLAGVPVDKDYELQQEIESIIDYIVE